MQKISVIDIIIKRLDEIMVILRPQGVENSNKDKTVIASSRWFNMGDTLDIWCEGWKRFVTMK